MRKKKYEPFFSSRPGGWGWDTTGRMQCNSAANLHPFGHEAVPSPPPGSLHPAARVP
jgi:hypothetical protein